MISVRNLSKSFGPTRAVRDVSFEIARGEVVGFLGPNGAGKTTTMRIITCYMPADSGSATVAGFDTTSQSLEVRRRIGYLPESAPLYDDMGVVEYLSYVAEIRGIQKALRTQRIREMVERCGLEKVVSKDIGELSKGYRQRVGLAQTLIHNPDVLVLDEPTSGLDPNQIREIRNLIREIGREKTVILSTHILPEVEMTCDRVIIIRDGQVVASDTPERLRQRSAGGGTYTIRVRGERARVESSLDVLPEVSRVNHRAEESPGMHRFEVTAGRDDIGEVLFRWAVDQRLVLAELRREDASLEDVFRELTAEEVEKHA
ncbi:MAG: ATP-binding cassette domain-containing protein [Acidobacteria bacterium]|nr:ATP-binding cassette domain-containing protein [Acidobacteriota bacterium]